MDTDAMAPYGLALRDFFSGDEDATIKIRRDDDYVSKMPVAVFFRQPADFSPLERAALALCQEHVLDVGAGTGCHSLALQEQGCQVTAIDILPHAVEIMRARGVRHVECVDVFDVKNTRPQVFDTLLLMMHGIGMVETLAGLDRFLQHARGLLSPDGQIICDSLDVRVSTDPVHMAYHETNRQAGRYVGEIRMSFEYKGHAGPLCGWLHVDAETLSRHARQAGWDCRVVHREENGDYLAQLT
jgi:SAM-dependent methyltransferase